MEQINVLMLGWELEPVISGGLGVVCREIVDNLVEKNVNVIFVIPKLPGAIQVDQFKLINARVSEAMILEPNLLINFSVESWITPYASIDSLKQNENWQHNDIEHWDKELYGFNLMEEVAKYAQRVSQIAAKLEFDVIHAHDWMTLVAGAQLKFNTLKPLVAHVHSLETDRTANHPNEQIRKIEKTGLAFADKIITVSDFTKHKLVEDYGLDRHKIEVVHNAIRKEKHYTMSTHLPAKIKTVLFVGRLSVQKGVDNLLRAAQMLLSKDKNIQFVFVGKGDLLAELINLSIDLGISDHVIFTGQMNHAEIDKVYHRADLFVTPSVSEPFGITALEAIKYGVPLIISKQSGASEVIKNCFKVDFWDVHEMANMMMGVLQHGTLSETMIHNAQKDLDEINWQSQVDKIINVYHSLL